MIMLSREDGEMDNKPSWDDNKIVTNFIETVVR